VSEGNIDSAWARIEQWLTENVPALGSGLAPGASEERIAKAERELGIALPADFRRSTIQHDGEHGSVGGVLGGWNLRDLSSAIRVWKAMNSLVEDGTFSEAESDRIKTVGPVRPQWWNRHWVPFATDGGGNEYALDMDPRSGGSPGQVILFLHDSRRRSVMAPSFAAWLSSYADDLEGGKYRVELTEQGNVLGLERVEE
jgi:cell wall assembly regulator SMI1